MKVTAEFVRSAAAAADFPRDQLPEVALVGRSNVGKSSLINALLRQRLARTSADPGKTRLANIYRVTRGSAPPLYLVDLPGYGYARGGRQAAAGFDALTRAYFGRMGRGSQERPAGEAESSSLAAPGAPGPGVLVSALLLVDARHPGLESDRMAWQWILTAAAEAALVATKVDKLARGERIRAMRKLESVFENSVLPVSAVTGEGLDELWKLIDNLANSRNPKPSSRNSPSRLPRATAPLPPKR